MPTTIMRSINRFNFSRPDFRTLLFLNHLKFLSFRVSRLAIFLGFLFTGIFGHAQIINIPDPYFKQALLNNGVDISMDGEIDQEEALLILDLDVNSYSISSLDGIEHFTNLVSLNCSFNNLTELNMASNTQLEFLDCSYNELINLNIDNNNLLHTLSCYDNFIPNLNLASLNQLISLNCSGNFLTEIDVSSNTQLEFFACSANSLTELNIANNNVLHSLICSYNNIPTLDFNPVNQIERLDCYGNGIDSIDLSPLSNLRFLDIGFNDLNSIDLSGNQQLDTLFCSSSYQLDTLDVSNNQNLTVLSCGSSNMNALIISNPILKYLQCSYNDLEELDLSSAPSLKEIFCGNNNITSLDLSNLYNLEKISAVSNGLMELNISGDSSLIYLFLTNNLLDTIIKGHHPTLDNIQIGSNNFSDFDFSGLPELRAFYGGSNKFSHFTVDSPNLQYLELTNNDSLAFLDISLSTSINSLSLSNNEQPFTVCVWIMPFPPESVNLSDNGSPNITFTDNCTISNASISGNDFNIYPNPVNHYLNIETGIRKSDPVKISLFDVQGKIWYQAINTKLDLIQLDVSGFHRGIYILQLETENEVVQKKVILG